MLRIRELFQPFIDTFRDVNHEEFHFFLPTTCKWIMDCFSEVRFTDLFPVFHQDIQGKTLVYTKNPWRPPLVWLLYFDENYAALRQEGKHIGTG